MRLPLRSENQALGVPLRALHNVCMAPCINRPMHQLLHAPTASMCESPTCTHAGAHHWLLAHTAAQQMHPAPPTRGGMQRVPDLLLGAPLGAQAGMADKQYVGGSTKKGCKAFQITYLQPCSGASFGMQAGIPSSFVRLCGRRVSAKHQPSKQLL